MLTPKPATLFLGLAAGCRQLPAAPAQGPALDPARIAEVVGVDATRTDDGTVRVTWPRTEVAVAVDGLRLSPPAGLTSWAAFAPTAEGAMLMGDTVVFQDEAGPAMDAAFAHGLDVTALHNHFFFDDPPVYFMHVGGRGDAERLAQGVRAMWDAIRALRRARPQPSDRASERAPVPGALDSEAIARVLGHPAKVNGGVVKVSIGRTATMHGTSFGGSMGLSTWAAFTGSHAYAAVDGDFAMTAKEVQPVLRALRRAGIDVVALHNHMVGETPAYYFTHYWGTGPALELARGLRTALDAQARAQEPVTEG